MDEAVGDHLLRIHQAVPALFNATLRIDQGDRNFNWPRLLHCQVGRLQVKNGEAERAVWEKIPQLGRGLCRNGGSGCIGQWSPSRQ